MEPRPPKGAPEEPNRGYGDNADSVRRSNFKLFKWEVLFFSDLRRGDGPKGDMYGGLANKGLLSGSSGFGGGGGLGGANNWLCNISASVACLLCMKSVRGGAPGAGLL